MTGLIFTRIQEGTQLGGLTQPGQTEQGILYHVPSCWVLVGGGLGGGNSLVAQERAAAAVVESGFVARSGFVLFSVFPFSVSLLLLFPVFAVLLNCPYPDPPLSAFFFPFPACRREEGRLRGVFVAGGSRNQNTRVFLSTLFEKWHKCFPFSSHWGLPLTARTFQISWRVAWQLHQPVPSHSGMHLVRSHGLVYV